MTVSSNLSPKDHRVDNKGTQKESQKEPQKENRVPAEGIEAIEGTPASFVKMPEQRQADMPAELVAADNPVRDAEPDANIRAPEPLSLREEANEALNQRVDPEPSPRVDITRFLSNRVHAWITEKKVAFSYANDTMMAKEMAWRIGMLPQFVGLAARLAKKNGETLPCQFISIPDEEEDTYFGYVALVKANAEEKKKWTHYMDLALEFVKAETKPLTIQGQETVPFDDWCIYVDAPSRAADGSPLYLSLSSREKELIEREEKSALDVQEKRDENSPDAVSKARGRALSIETKNTASEGHAPESDASMGGDQPSKSKKERSKEKKAKKAKKLAKKLFSTLGGLYSNQREAVDALAQILSAHGKDRSEQIVEPRQPQAPEAAKLAAEASGDAQSTSNYAANAAKEATADEGRSESVISTPANVEAPGGNGAEKDEKIEVEKQKETAPTIESEGQQQEAKKTEACTAIAPDEKKTPEQEALDAEEARKETERKQKEKQKERLTKVSEIIQTTWRDSLLPEIKKQADLDELQEPMTLWMLEHCSEDDSEVAQALGLSNSKTADPDSVGNVLESVDLGNEIDRKKTLKTLLNAGRSVVVIIAPGKSSAFVKNNATRVISFKNANSRLNFVAAKLEAEGFGKPIPDGRPMAEYLSSLSIPQEKVSGALNWMKKICASEEPCTEKSMERLRKIINTRLNNKPESEETAPKTLDEVVGLNPLAALDLRRLLRKLKRTEPMSQGALLWGAPGTGKTMLAKILAQESEREFVHGSYAAWQSAGALDDHLSAMRETFEEAVKSAPSVLFIDEIDSIGRRNSGSRNDSYNNVVVNAMLELVQDSLRANVAIICATNYPTTIDEALTRPGRLGDWIEVREPDQDGRAAILRQLFEGAAIDFGSMARRTGQCSPAKLKALSEEAKEFAKERGLAICEKQDIDEAFAQATARLLAGRDWSRLKHPMSIGLCAQARMLWIAREEATEIQGVSLEPGLVDLGRVELSSASVPAHTTAADIMGDLHCVLAAAAGRQVAAMRNARSGANIQAMDALALLGEEDRKRAVRLATSLVNSGAVGRTTLKESAQGLHDDDGATKWTIERAILDAWEIAIKSARQGIHGIETAASALEQKGRLSASELRELLFGEPCQSLH